MARELTERTASILDSASTWQGVARVRTARGTTLRVDGRAFGRLDDGTIEANFPGKLPRTAVRHGLAEERAGEGWTRLDPDDSYDGTVLLRLAYLSHVARARASRPDAFPDVDIDAALAELDLLPGVVHLVREQART